MKQLTMKQLILAIAFVMAIFAGAIWWQVYAFKECKKVGHSTFYCIMRSGK